MLFPQKRYGSKVWLIGLLALGAGVVVALGCYMRARPPGHEPPAVTEAADRGPAVTSRALKAGDRLRVGAWNIEWLGTPNSRSGPARGHAQDPNDLAAYIIAANIDVLGLSEIASDGASGAWTSSIISDTLDHVEQSRGGEWRHELFEAHSGRNQLCGIAWDTTRVRALGEPVRITPTEKRSSQGKPLWSRPAVGQLFSAGPGLTDLLVIMCHNKSDYGGDFSVHRGEEADLFLAGLPAARPDPDILLIGDMNCGESDEPLVQKFITAGFVNLNASDTPTHIRYGALDRAMVPARQPEFSAGGFEVFSTAFLNDRQLTQQDFKVRFSDHFMVIATVNVMADDD